MDNSCTESFRISLFLDGSGGLVFLVRPLNVCLSVVSIVRVSPVLLGMTLYGPNGLD